MSQNEGNATERSAEIDKGPTEELRDMQKPENEKLVPGGEVPGAQNPDSEENKERKEPQH